MKNITTITPCFGHTWRVLACLLTLGMGGAAWALPNQITQEGLVTNAQGRAYTGPHRVTIRLYAAAQGGQPFFTEEHPNVIFFNGYYAVAVGSIQPLNGLDFLRDAVFVSIQIDNLAEGDPRTPFAKSPAAFVADVALNVTGDISPRSVSVGGNVVIDDRGRWVGDPTGLAGPAGAAGAQGPAGPQGPAGAAGVQGGNGSPDTPAQVKAKLVQVDGAGSGVDADLLDGLDSAAFVRAGQPIDADTLGGQALPAFVRSPQHVLDRLKTVDGSGSGVDADRLDGIDSTEFIRGAQQLLTSLKTVDGSGSGVDADRLDGIDSTEFIRGAQQLLALLKTVDGAGSGVDADRLDGLDSTQFFRTTGDVDLQGALTVSGTVRLSDALIINSANAAGDCNAAMRGSVYLNTSTGRFMGCTGDAWVNLNGGGGGGANGGGGAKALEVSNNARQWSNGTFAKSCKEYREDGDYAGEGSGKYRINNGRDTFEVYCDMQTAGGGWTMLGHYAHPGSTNSPAGHDNRDYAYYMKARSTTTYGNVAYIANPNSAGPWTDWRVLDGINFPGEFAVVMDQGNFAPGWENYPAKTVYKVKRRDIMPNHGTIQNLISGDNLLYKLNTGDAWSDVGGGSNSGTYYWYPYAANGRSLTRFHVSNYRYLDGRAPTNYHYSNLYGTGIPGGNDTWHHGSRLLFRELGPPKVPIAGKHIITDAQGSRKWSDGSLAKTCKEYRNPADATQYQGDIGDGLYKISTASGAIDVYCDMTTDGGGWTVVGHYRHPGNGSSPADIDNRDYAYYMRAHTNQTYGNAAYVADPNSPGPWTDWRPLQNMGWPAEMAVVMDQPVFSTNWESWAKKAVYKVKDRSIMPNYGTSQNLASPGNLFYKQNTRDAWTPVHESSSSGRYYWYPRSANDRHLTLFHASNYRYIDDRPATNYHYSNYYGSGLIGGDDSWHHGSRILVREMAAPLAANVKRLVVGADGVRTWQDGSVESTCKRYLTNAAYGGATGDGKYRISTAVGNTVVYCDMNTDGGGWTMVGHYRHQGNTNAPNGIENRDYAYFMKARNNASYGRAAYLADPNSMGPWTDWRPLSSVAFPLEFAVVLDQGDVNWNSGWENHGRKAIYRIKSRNIMPNHGTTQDLITGDNVYYKLNFQANWADLSGDSRSGTYYWYPRNGAHLTLFHTSNYKFLDGRAATNYHYSNYWGSGMGGNDSWHHPSRLLVRELN